MRNEVNGNIQEDTASLDDLANLSPVGVLVTLYICMYGSAGKWKLTAYLLRRYIHHLFLYVCLCGYHAFMRTIVQLHVCVFAHR